MPCWHGGGQATIGMPRSSFRIWPAVWHRVQLTTDGHKPYLDAVEDAFGATIDYAMLDEALRRGHERRERGTAPRCASEPAKIKVMGEPDPDAHQHELCGARRISPCA